MATAHQKHKQKSSKMSHETHAKYLLMNP